MPAHRRIVQNQGKKTKFEQKEKKVSPGPAYNWQVPRSLLCTKIGQLKPVNQFLGIGLFLAVLAILYYKHYEAGTPEPPPLRRQQRSQLDFLFGDETIFTVMDIPGKGKGVIAARGIKVRLLTLVLLTY